jgi:hypothetical protein
MFEFTKRKMAQLEAKILEDFNQKKAIMGFSVAKLDNEAAVRCEGDLQRELL